MSSIDPATPAQQEEKAPVPVTHPAWCDRSLCTAPEFVPTEYGPEHYAHRSVNLAVLGDYVPAGRDHRQQDVAYLSQGVAPWECRTYLKVGGASIEVGWASPLLWAVVDEHAQLAARWSGLITEGRQAARELIERTKQARS